MNPFLFLQTWLDALRNLTLAQAASEQMLVQLTTDYGPEADDEEDGDGYYAHWMEENYGKDWKTKAPRHFR